MKRFSLQIGFLAVFLAGFIFSAHPQGTETITLTTYYPAPYGVYVELRAQRMAIGPNWYKPATVITAGNDLLVEEAVGIGLTNPSANGYKLDATNAGNCIRGVSTANTGVTGQGGPYGVRANGTQYALDAYSDNTAVNAVAAISGTSVWAHGARYGIDATATDYPVRATGGTTAVRGASGSQRGVEGVGSPTGVWGDGTTYGVYGSSGGADPLMSGIGVVGVGTQYGVYGGGGATTGLFGTGTYGVIANGTQYGVETTGNNAGVQAMTTPGGTAVWAIGGQYGVDATGSTFAVQGTGGTAGVMGSGTTYGVEGGGPTGVYGNGTTYGVQGVSPIVGVCGGVSTNPDYSLYGIQGWGSWSAIYANSPGGAGVEAYGGWCSFYSDGSGWAMAEAPGTHIDFLAQGPGVKYATFTGAHDCLLPKDYSKFKPGMLVCSTGQTHIRKDGGKITISYTLPMVRLADKPEDKTIFGAYVGEISKRGDHWYTGKEPKGMVNAVGEGRAWVTDINGSIEVGDFITTSYVVGYGQRQNDDLKHTYTLGKVTESVDWDKVKDTVEYQGKKYKAYLIAMTYTSG